MDSKFPGRDGRPAGGGVQKKKKKKKMNCPRDQQKKKKIKKIKQSRKSTAENQSEWEKPRREANAKKKHREEKDETANIQKGGGLKPDCILAEGARIRGTIRRSQGKLRREGDQKETRKRLSQKGKNKVNGGEEPPIRRGSLQTPQVTISDQTPHNKVTSRGGRQKTQKNRQKGYIRRERKQRGPRIWRASRCR